MLMNRTNRQPYFIQARESDNPQDIGQNKNAKIQESGWLVDDLYKLIPKTMRLIWEQKCTGDWKLAKKVKAYHTMAYIFSSNGIK